MSNPSAALVNFLGFARSLPSLQPPPWSELLPLLCLGRSPPLLTDLLPLLPSLLRSPHGSPREFFGGDLAALLLKARQQLPVARSWVSFPGSRAHPGNPCCKSLVEGELYGGQLGSYREHSSELFHQLLKELRVFISHCREPPLRGFVLRHFWPALCVAQQAPEVRDSARESIWRDCIKRPLVLMEREC